MEIFEIVILSLSGLLLFFAGANRLFNPIKSLCLKTYLDNPEIKLESEVDIFNEMRGTGSVTAVVGIIILLGIIIPQIRLTSFVVVSFFFIGFAIGRLLSIGLDGKPNKLLIQGLISELVFGAAHIFCLYNVLG